MRRSSSYRTLIPLLLTVCMAWSHEGQQNNSEYRQNKIIAMSKDTQQLSYGKDAGDWTPAGVINGIDALTFAKMTADGVPINGTCDDATFIRRVSLILTGRLPDPERTRTFLADTASNKRATYIDEVLAGEAFNTHWAFWFQEYFQSTGSVLRSGLTWYNDWLAEAVASSMPLDTMAEEMMLATGLTDEQGAPNFYARSAEMARLPQDVWDNFAINASTKFLGVPLTCISCHDGAYHLEDINLYLAERKREDLWAMASYFTEIDRRPGTRSDNLILSLNVIRVNSEGYMAESDSGDRPVRDGGLITPKYMFDGSTPTAGASFVQTIADKITNDRQFARNFANRFWGHAFGLAMVEPMDSFDLYRIDPEYPLPEGWEQQALDLDLLEHMTDKMIEFKFDMRDYLRYVLNSATFQMSSEYLPGNWQDTYAPYYTRYLAHRMSAESVFDSIVVATGVIDPIRQTRRNGETTDVYEADYAHQLIDIDQPRGRNQSDVGTFLQAFGRGNRFDIPRTSDGGITQALLMMNSTVLTSRMSSPSRRLNTYLDGNYTTDQIIRELYLDVLCREPSESESNALKDELASYETLELQAVTAQWLLINKVEFNFIY